MFKVTRNVRKLTDKSVGVYVGSAFGIKEGDILDLRVYRIDDPERVYCATKRAHRRGSSVAITLDKGWLLEPGDMVVIEYEKVGEENDS